MGAMKNADGATVPPKHVHMTVGARKMTDERNDRTISVCFGHQRQRGGFDVVPEPGHHLRQGVRLDELREGSLNGRRK
jgi:hypothetical protein